MTNTKGPQSHTAERSQLAEESLQRSEALLRIASKLGRLGGWELDIATQQVYWSEETREIHEWAPDVMPRLDVAIDFYVPEHRPLIRRAVERCIREGVAFDEELRFVTAKGKRIWVRAIGQACRDDDGTVVRIHGAIQDITERKQAEQSLFANESIKQQASNLSYRLQDILQSISDAFFAVDRDWRFTFINAGAEHLLERSRDELLGRNIWDEFPIAVDSTFYSEYHRAISENQTTSFEEYFPPLNRWFEVTAYPSSDGLAVYFRDVTQRRESEERFRLLSQATSDAIWDWDLITNQVWRNAGFAQLCGHPMEDTIGCTADWTRRIHSADRERVLASIQQVIDQGGTSWKAEYRFLRGDGSHVYVVDRGTVIRDTQGRPIRMIGGMTNQTERISAENEIRRLNDELEDRVSQRTAELEAANKELEAFCYSVSHDLRAPLRSINSFSLIIAEDYAAILDKEGNRLLNIIRCEAQRLDRLIHDLLEFSKTGRQPVSATQCDLNEAAQAAFESIPLSDRMHVKRFELSKLPLVQGDHNMLRQVWTNLITNAVKFTRCRAEATIEVGGWSEGERATYFVRDNGIGFDPRYKQKLFRVFQRLHGEDEFEGTGVGLAIVQRIIHRHGGTVWAEGQPDAGATIFFTLPLRQVDCK